MPLTNGSKKDLCRKNIDYDDGDGGDVSRVYTIEGKACRIVGY